MWMKRVACALQDLERSMEGLNIRTDLHLCYLITPYNEILCRDWQKCYDVIVRLQVSAGRVAPIAQRYQAGATLPFLYACNSLSVLVGAGHAAVHVGCRDFLGCPLIVWQGLE